MSCASLAPMFVCVWGGAGGVLKWLFEGGGGGRGGRGRGGCVFVMHKVSPTIMGSFKQTRVQLADIKHFSPLLPPSEEEEVGEGRGEERVLLSYRSPRLLLVQVEHTHPLKHRWGRRRRRRPKEYRISRGGRGGGRLSASFMRLIHPKKRRRRRRRNSHRMFSRN